MSKHKFTVVAVLIPSLFFVAFSYAVQTTGNAQKLNSNRKASGTGDEKHAPAHLESQAIQLVAKLHGRKPETLFVYGSSTINLPITQPKAHSYTVMEKDFSWSKQIVLDADGNQVDLEQLLAAELAAHDAKYGRLEPDLFERLEKAADDEILSVRIAVDVPLGNPAEMPQDPLPNMNAQTLQNMTEAEKKATLEMDEKYERDLLEYRQRLVREAAAPVAAKLTALGYKSLNLGRTIAVSLPAHLGRVVAKWEGVQSVGLEKFDSTASPQF